MSCFLLFFSPPWNMVQRGWGTRSIWLAEDPGCLGFVALQDWAPVGGTASRAQIQKPMSMSHHGPTTTTLTFSCRFSQSVLQLPNGVMDTSPRGCTRMFRGKTLKTGWRPFEKQEEHLSMWRTFLSRVVNGRAEGGLSGCRLGAARPHSLCSLRLRPHLSPADDTGTSGQQDHLMGVPNSHFVLVLTHFNFLSFNNYGTGCVLNSMGPVIWTMIKTDLKRTHFYQHPFSFGRCLC